ncbi:MAG: hypothetical protein JSV37_02580, partial [Anaerolineaceae bacterium]
AVVADGFISFMGFTRNIINWGTLMYDAFTYAQQLGSMDEAWHVLIPSAVSLSLFAFAFYLVSRGMYDVADPRIVERRARERQDGLLLQLRRRLRKVARPEITAPALPSPLSVKSQLQPGRIIQATLLFAKLHNSSLPGESLQDEILTRSNGKQFRDAIPIISQYGGLVSYIDLSTMVASFGITPGRLPPQVSALLATHAGLELMDYVTELNKERSDLGLANYKLSVGIATGLVRGHEKQDAEDTPYPFMGDVVRTAQRLQEFTVSINSGGVLISEETYKFIKTVLHQFSFGRQGPVKFPWESEQKMVYEVVERSQRIFEPNWELHRLPKVTSRRALISRTAWMDVDRG